MNANDLIFVTVDYKVVAIQKADGRVIWETELVKKFFKPATPFVSLAVDATGIYAHTLGQLYRLDPASGTIMWQTELPSDRWIKGQCIASVVTLNSNSATAAYRSAQAQSERQQSD